MGVLNKNELKAGGFDSAADDWFSQSFDQSLTAAGYYRMKKILEALASSTAPIALSAPQLPIKAETSKIVTAVRGDYTVLPTNFTQRWKINGAVIPNATGMSYTPSESDIGKLLSFEEIPSTTAGIGQPNISGGVLVTLADPTTVTLQQLVLSANRITENTVAGTLVGTISGKAGGSTLTVIDDAGGRFALNGTNIVTGLVATDYETAQLHSVVVRETLVGAAGSPKDTTFTVNVTNVYEKPNLGTLALASLPEILLVGQPASGNITGATQGSTISASGLPDGFTINSAARTWAWSGVGSGATPTVSLVETLSDSANSPKVTPVSFILQATAPSSLSASGPTGISLHSSNGRNATTGSRWIIGPNMTNVMGNGTTGAPGALACRIRFKPAELVSNPSASSITVATPIWGTYGSTGGGTMFLGYGGQNMPSPNDDKAGRFYARLKDGTQTNTVYLFSQPVASLVDSSGVLACTVVIRRDNAGAFSVDVYDNAGNKLAGDPVTPTTWTGRATNTGNRPLIFGHEGGATPSYGSANWFPGAISDFVQLDVAGSDVEWSSFARGVNPSTVWGSGLAAYYPMRNPSDLTKASGTRTSTTNYPALVLSSDGVGLLHGTLSMGKMARSTDGTKGIAWVPVYRGYTHALSPSVVRACTSLADLRNAQGTIVRDVLVDGAATHLQARAISKLTSAIVKDWTRVTSAPVTGKTTVSLPGVRAGSMEMLLELRREDDPTFVAQCGDDNRVGITAVMGPSQSQMAIAMTGATGDPYTATAGLNTTVTFSLLRSSTNNSVLPNDGGYLMYPNLLGTGAVAMAQYWDSLNCGVPLEIVPMAIVGTMTTGWMYHQNVTSTGGACIDFFGDGVNQKSGFASATLLAKKKRVTMFLSSWHTADRSSAFNTGVNSVTDVINVNTIYGARSPIEFDWTKRWNEFVGGVAKPGATSAEIDERTNLVKSGLTAWQPWSVIIPVSRTSVGNRTNPNDSSAGMQNYTNQRKQQYDYAELGVGRDAAVIASLGGFQNDIRMDGSTSPHQHLTHPMGQAAFGLRLAHAVAHVTKASTINPRVMISSIIGAGTDTLTVTVDMVNGGSLMTGTNGATINGFDVQLGSGTSASYYDGVVPFTAIITGSNTIQLRKASGTWPVGTIVRYLSGAPVSINTTTGAEADELSNIVGMLYESRPDTVPSALVGSIPAGVPVMPTIDPIIVTA